MNQQLRDQLQEITESAEIIPARIAAVNALGIKSVPEPLSWQKRKYQGIININCYSYALGLGDSDKYRHCVFIEALHHSNRLTANSNFIEYLIQNHLIEPAENKPESLIIYLNEKGFPRHGGLVSDSGFIHSKWGSIDIFEHKVWDVPAAYGSEIRFFKKPAPTEAKKLFFKYARTVCESESNI